MVQYRICPGVTFGLLTILSRFLTIICSCWLEVLYELIEIIRVHSKDILGLVMNAGVVFAYSRRLIISRPVIAVGLTRKSMFDVM